ncbi:MAG: FixH family protein [Planctomycetota bacterium]|jgi:nitrogen fixation protein FixH
MRPHVIWISVVVGILGTCVLFYAILIVAATSDPSFAVAENYEADAANWNALARERQLSEQLGWTVTLATTPIAQPDHRELALTVTDRRGEPVRGARVEVAALHVARAADVVRAELAERGDGVYAAPLRMKRSGIWEFRIRVEHGEDRFVETRREKLLIPPTPPARTTP